MGFLQTILDSIRSLFFTSAPDVKKRQDLRKVDAFLKEYKPTLYKGGLLQANFAEVFNILYTNTKPIEKILSETIASEEVPRNNRYIDQLLMTGFSLDTQRLIASLSYENRRKAILALDENANLQRHFEEEHRALERIIREINSENFKKIDGIISKMQQLADICQFNYMNALHLFDPDYTGLPDYSPVFQPLPPEPLADICADLYYLVKEFGITTSMANALIALANLRGREDITEREKSDLNLHLRKIETIFKKVLTPELLLAVVQMARQDPRVVLDSASYGGTFRKNFAERFQQAFSTDETRLRTEIKDRTIASEVKEMLGERNLVNLTGYTAELSMQLHQGGTSFLWVTPLQIMKTFITYYYDEKIRALLNDVVIEGFFQNPSYKTDFSSVVFACNETIEHIKTFEAAFDKGGQYDSSILLGYIRDSSKDADFLKRLVSTVNTINGQVKELMQTETDHFVQLYKMISDVLLDIKKASSDTITNIKVLFNSSRNRGYAERLETEHARWKVFFEIMKNYIAVGSTEKGKGK